MTITPDLFAGVFVLCGVTFAIGMMVGSELPKMLRTYLDYKIDVEKLRTAANTAFLSSSHYSEPYEIPLEELPTPSEPHRKLSRKKEETA